MTIKTIYLARRNPNITAEDFPQRWREHSTLAGKFSHLQKYFTGVVQCCKVHDSTILPEAVNDFDGVNLITMTSDDAEASTAFWDEPDAVESMLPDELRVFDRYVRKFSMVVEQQVLHDGVTTGFGVITFLKRRDGSDSAEFVRRWGTSLLRLPAFQRYVRRYVRNQIVLPPPPGYEFDLVSELWCDSLEDIAALYTDAAYQTQLAADTAALCETARNVTMPIRVTHSKGVIKP